MLKKPSGITKTEFSNVIAFYKLSGDYVLCMLFVFKFYLDRWIFYCYDTYFISIIHAL